jgi:hypothetical protein
MYVETKTALKGAALDPRLTLAIVKDAIRLRRKHVAVPAKTLIGTHHKVLTAYMARVSRAFSVIKGQTFCRATSPYVDYDKDVILDYHSTFELDKVAAPFRGIHIRRDPRDVLVSCVLYHLKSSEPWLHEEGNWGFSGSTYQKELRALGSMDERLLFELDHEGGSIIEGMTSWDYTRPEFVELGYESIVGHRGMEYIHESLIRSGLFDTTECSLLVNLFRIFSAEGALAHKRHIRNPRPSQWTDHFSPAVEHRFGARFGKALEYMGYA